MVKKSLILFTIDYTNCLRQGEYVVKNCPKHVYIICESSLTRSPNYTSVSPSAFKTFNFIKIRRTRNKIIISKGFFAIFLHLAHCVQNRCWKKNQDVRFPPGRFLMHEWWWVISALARARRRWISTAKVILYKSRGELSLLVQYTQPSHLGWHRVASV